MRDIERKSFLNVIALIAIALALGGLWRQQQRDQQRCKRRRKDPEKSGSEPDESATARQRAAGRETGLAHGHGTAPNFNYGQIDGTVLDGYFIINAVMPVIFRFDASGHADVQPGLSHR